MLDFLNILQFAFPDNNHSPTKFAKLFLILSVSSDSALKFRQPVTLVCGGGSGAGTVRMTMPETPVHEKDRAKLRQNDVRFSG